jgi:hypothetical protein
MGRDRAISGDYLRYLLLSYGDGTANGSESTHINSWRANKARGHGTWETDHPPVLGIVGRESGQLQWILKKKCKRGS